MVLEFIIEEIEDLITINPIYYDFFEKLYELMPDEKLTSLLNNPFWLPNLLTESLRFKESEVLDVYFNLFKESLIESGQEEKIGHRLISMTALL